MNILDATIKALSGNIEEVKNLKESKEVKTESTLSDIYQQLDDSRDVTDVEGLIDDVLVVTDPDVTSDEYEEIIDRAQEIVDSTPEGNLPYDDKYIGQYLLQCPICGSYFVQDAILEPGATCPVCMDVPEAFIVIGKLEAEDVVAEQEGIETEGEEEEPNPVDVPTEEEPVEDEDEEKEPLAASEEVRTSDNKLEESKLTEGEEDKEFQYMLLNRLKSDCDYFLGYGNRNEKYLWAHNVDEQIAKMKELWNSFSEDEKPEWLSMEDIENYEKQMKEESKLIEDKNIDQMTPEELAKYIFDNFEEITDMSKDSMLNTDGKEIVDSIKLDKVAKKIQPELEEVCNTKEDMDYVLYTLEGMLSDYVSKDESNKITEGEMLTVEGPISDYIEITADREQWDYPIDDEDEAMENNSYVVKSTADKRIYEVTGDEWNTIAKKLNESKSLQESLEDNSELMERYSRDISYKIEEAKEEITTGEDFAAFLSSVYSIVMDEIKNCGYDIPLNESEMKDKIGKEGLKSILDELQEVDSSVLAQAFIQAVKEGFITGKGLNTVYNQCKSWEDKDEEKLTEEVTVEEVTNLHEAIENAEDMDEIQDIIFSISDSVLENEVQLAFDQCEQDGDDLDTVKGNIITTLEDNSEYLDESKKLNESDIDDEFGYLFPEKLDEINKQFNFEHYSYNEPNEYRYMFTSEEDMNNAKQVLEQYGKVLEVDPDDYREYEDENDEEFAKLTNCLVVRFNDGVLTESKIVPSEEDKEYIVAYYINGTKGYQKVASFDTFEEADKFVASYASGELTDKFADDQDEKAMNEDDFAIINKSSLEECVLTESKTEEGCPKQN